MLVMQVWCSQAGLLLPEIVYTPTAASPHLVTQAPTAQIVAIHAPRKGVLGAPLLLPARAVGQRGFVLAALQGLHHMSLLTSSALLELQLLPLHDAAGAEALAPCHLLLLANLINTADFRTTLAINPNTELQVS